MNERAGGYRPSGPLDPIAAQVSDFFRVGPMAQAFASGSIPIIRAALKAASIHAILRPVAHIADYRVPVAGGDIGVRLYRPAVHPHALIVWSHGGGFVLGSVAESDSFARALAVETGCAVLSVDYRLAPEHKFPIPVDDVLCATMWASERRAELAGGNVPLIVGGDSAGANLSTVVTRKLHEAKTCTIAGNVLIYPCTDSYDAASLRSFVPPFLSVEDVTWFFDMYLPDVAARTHPDFAPLHAPNLKLLPPTLIITAEHDIITEQAEAYGQTLAAHGVKVKTSRYPGMIHGFATIDVFFAGGAGKVMHEIGGFIADSVKSAR